MREIKNISLYKGLCFIHSFIFREKQLLQSTSAHFAMNEAMNEHERNE